MATGLGTPESVTDSRCGGYRSGTYTTAPLFVGARIAAGDKDKERITDSMRALVVDDDNTFCRLLTKILQGSGIEADWTTDSLAGYHLSCQLHYDLFILDVRMPLLLGTEFAAGVKKENPAAKILLISAFADDALHQTAADLGVLLLSKPFTPDRLLQAITELLGRSVSS